MAARLADFVVAILGRAIAERGRASIALSGGSTPEPLYRALARQDLAWSAVTAVLVDERFAPPSDPASNEGFVRRTLAQDSAASIRLIGLWRDGASLDEAAAAASRDLSTIERPFDVVILGMGVDGHTASWFPGASGLEAALDPAAPAVAAIRAPDNSVAGAVKERLTLSFPALRDARCSILMMIGENKRRVFVQACEPGAVSDMPVRALLRARPDLWACWAP